jgi:hypothetical protein
MVERLPYPQREGSDVARALAVAASASVPVIGGPASTLLAYWLPAAFENRLKAWSLHLDHRLAAVEDTVFEAPAFQTLVLAATRAAYGTHVEEKLELLARGLQSVATGRTTDQFMAMRHIQHVEALELEHFMVLGRLAEGQVRVPDLDREPDFREMAVPGLESHLVAPCVRDLAARHLAVVHDPNSAASIRAPGGVWTVTITTEGRELVEFVQLMEDGSTRPSQSPSTSK